MLKKLYDYKNIKDKNGRVYYYDNLKFFLIFMVVFGHYIDIKYHISDISKSLWLFVYTFHMPLFIFVSGYMSKRLIKREEYSKIFKLITLYFIMSFILFLFSQENLSISLLSTLSVQWYLFALAIWYMISIKLKNYKFIFVFLFFIFLALIIGYDSFFGDFLILSRIIVFYPFFYLGLHTSNDVIQKITSNMTVKILSLVILIVIVIVYFINFEFLAHMRPLLTGRNHYLTLLENYQPYAIVIRLIIFGASSLIGFCILNIIPKGKTIFSEFGKNTLSVYFLHWILYYVFDWDIIKLSTTEILFFSFFLTCVLSTKYIGWIFNKFMNINITKDKLSDSVTTRKKIIKEKRLL